MRKSFLSAAIIALFLAQPLPECRPEELTRRQQLEEAGRLHESGRKLMEQGDYKAANEQFARAQSLLGGTADPAPGAPAAPATPEENIRRADLLYNQAVIAIGRQEFKKAQSCLEEAVGLNPRDKDAFYNLGVIYEVFLKDRNEAAKCYLRYVLLETDAEKAATVKGWLSEIKKGAAK